MKTPIIIHHGSTVRRLTLKRLRACRHEELGGSGVSFSRDVVVARRFTSMYGSFISADASGLNLYELSAEEQLFNRRKNGQSLATLCREGFDGIDFCHSVEAFKLHAEAAAAKPGQSFCGFKVTRPPAIPSIEHEVWVFKAALGKLKPADVPADA